MATIEDLATSALMQAPPDDRQRLRSEIIGRAVKLGEGIDHERRPMPWILDMREVLLTEPGLRLAARLLWEPVRELRPDIVAGVGISGTPLVAALVVAAGAGGEPLDGVVIREQRKAYGRTRRIEGAPLAPGARAVIVDDVVNSGATVEVAASALAEFQAEVVGVAAVVDLESPRSRAVASTHSVQIRSLFTATELGFGVRLPSYRRVPHTRWASPLTTEPNSTLTTTREGYLIVSGDETTFLDRDGAVRVGTGVGSRPGRRMSQTLRANDLHVDIGDDGTACGVDGSGRIRWKFRTGRRLDVEPALCGDLILFATIHRSVVGVDARSGRLRWTTNLGATARTCPCVVDARTVALLAGGDVCLVDTEHGELLWWRGGTEARAVASAGDGRFAVLDATGLTEYDFEARDALGASFALRNPADSTGEQSRDDAPAPTGLHPAVAVRRALDQYLRTGRLPAPPARFAGDYEAPGGVWISARRRSDSWILARGGSWSFEPDARSITMAVWDGLQRLVGDGAHRLQREWPNVKIAITLVHGLERVELGALDHERFGVVATPAGRCSPAGDAPPNSQGVASELEQYRHARARAGLRPAEPADLYRYSTSKLTEPGETWLPHASPPRRIDTRLGEALVARARAEIAAAADGRESATDPPGSVLDALVEAEGAPVAGVAVSIYFRGIVGCATGWRGPLAQMVGDAARAAYRDARLTDHVARPENADAVVVTLLHSPVRLAGVPASYFARTLQRGLDSFSVRQGPRFAVFLDSVLPHYDWRPEHALNQLLAKAGISAGSVTWTSYRSAAWAYAGGQVFAARRGFVVHNEPLSPTTAIPRLATFLMEHRTSDGLIAWRTFPVLGREESHGSLSHAIHALYALARAGATAGEPKWVEAGERGLLASLDDTPHPTMSPGRVPSWRSSWSTNAVLLLALTAIAVPTDKRRKLLQLAAAVRHAVRDDGSVAPTGTPGSAADDHDYLPGVVILALARLAGLGIDTQPVDWRQTLAWYRRRFRVAPSWGIAFWHPQAWAAVYALEPRSEYADFVFEIVDWVLERQLVHSGAFVTDPSPSIPSFHTACAAEGVAAAWALADRLGETNRMRRYKASWYAAAGSLAQLTIAPEDMFCMRDRRALGGVRMHAASGEVRADYVSHALLAYLEAPLP